MAVFKPELRQYHDVIIVSTKGHLVNGELLGRHLASMTGGGIIFLHFHINLISNHTIYKVTMRCHLRKRISVMPRMRKCRIVHASSRGRTRARFCMPNVEIGAMRRLGGIDRVEGVMYVTSEQC